MEKYTDRRHPKYVPGTYSIYSSAVIRQMHKEVMKRRDSQRSSTITEGTNSLSAHSLSMSTNLNSHGVEKFTMQPHDLGLHYDYRFDPKVPLEMIPELKTRFGVILLPQPTNSRNDPFNWAWYRKAVHFLILMILTAVTAAITNNASTPQESINDLTGISYDALNNSAGVLFISIAISTWLYAPLASLCGRKLSFLIGMLFGMAGSIWYARMQNVGDSFGSQFLIGLSEGCTEAQVQLCLSSIFFRHQVGAVITIYVLSYSLGTYLGPLVANYVSENSSFRWVGWANAIASGVSLFIVIFLFEEDSFNYTRFKHHTREAILNFSLAQHGIVSNDDDLTLGYFDKKWPLWKRLAPVKESAERILRSPRKFLSSYFRLLYFNVKCIWFPPVLFAGIIWGLQNAILTFYLTTEDTYFYSAPFNYSSETVACMNIPLIIGSTIGCIYSGSLTDYFVLWLARKRRGIVESEFRLLFMFLSGMIGAAGLLMFGLGVVEQLNWRVFYIGLGFIGYMFSSASNISMLYVLDTYDELILETLVAVAFINNLLGCIFTFACSPWLQHAGTKNTYIALAAITLGLTLITVPYLIWGKKWRKMTKSSYNEMIEVRMKENKEKENEEEEGTEKKQEQ